MITRVLHRIEYNMKSPPEFFHYSLLVHSPPPGLPLRKISHTAWATLCGSSIMIWVSGGGGAEGSFKLAIVATHTRSNHIRGDRAPRFS